MLFVGFRTSLVNFFSNLLGFPVYVYSICSARYTAADVF